MKNIITLNGILLLVGNEYIIDESFNNSGVVELVRIYGKFFCRVKEPKTGVEWDTMCNRLSIKK